VRPSRTRQAAYSIWRVVLRRIRRKRNLYVDGSDIYNEATFGFIQGGCQATTVSILGTSPVFSFYLRFDCGHQVRRISHHRPRRARDRTFVAPVPAAVSATRCPSRH